ncbi:hypothetical protein QTP70_030577, partial [Hemibagrus guttatus]
QNGIRAFTASILLCQRETGLVRPVLDLQVLNSALMKSMFKMLTTKLITSQIRFEDWFVMIDLKDAYFHVGIQLEHRKFLRCTWPPLLRTTPLSLVSCFLRGARQLRPSCRPRLPSWYFFLVLDRLLEAPFEPMESASEKFLTLKTALLLALASLRQVGDMQALSWAPTCLEFASGMSKAILHPRAGYVPKVTRMAGRLVILQAFCFLPRELEEQERLHLLCPVRALKTYVHCSGSCYVLRFLLQKAGPLRTPLSGFITWIWTPLLGLRSFRANGCSVPGPLVLSHGPRDRHRTVCGGMGIDVHIASVMMQYRVPSKGNYNRLRM